MKFYGNTKIWAGSGTVSGCISLYKSADPDADQNYTDPKHCPVDLDLC